MRRESTGHAHVASIAARASASFMCVFMAVGQAQAQAQAQEHAPNRRAVRSVGDQSFKVAPGETLRLFGSAPLAGRHPDVVQILVIIHGRLRNADTYFRTGVKAAEASGLRAEQVLVIAPQFLADVDVQAHGLLATTLRWSLEGWEGGSAALAPAPRSSFAALDALLGSFVDVDRFPRLARVVIAGHSGGGQVVQRYAIAGRADAQFAGRGIALRYVVANPSSYAWFTDERPRPDIAAACPGYDRWKYGMSERPAPLDAREPADIERAYVARDVTYLLGGADTDPQHPALDRSCAALAQGAFRLERGQAFVGALRARNGAATHRLAVIPGVGHEAGRMFGSDCGLAALFDRPGCPALAR